jgi:hypothetical protein
MKRLGIDKRISRQRQRGAITMFSAVLILILLTEMILYAVQVGVFEQRKSSNERFQKLAFHTADAGIQQAKQFISVNAGQVARDTGWLATRWQPCPDSPDASHPCSGEPVDAFRSGSYFYSFDGSDLLPLDPDNLPLDSSKFDVSQNEQVSLHALMCMLEIDVTQDPVVQGCTRDATRQDSRYFMVTLLARGRADCDDSGNNCGAEALVSEKIGSFGPVGREGGPGVPLTARTAVPLSGTVNVVPNPNGGGLGVPISSWVNATPESSGCSLGIDPISPDSASYETCEVHEWYGLDAFPEDYLCPGNKFPCRCKRGEDRLLSYTEKGNERILNFDVVPDPDFPCDLFAYTFGVPKDNYQAVKSMVPSVNRLTGCSSLDENSSGWYWISGPLCDLPEQVGSKDNPVFLISAAKFTRANAQSNMFGVLFVTDAEYEDKGYSCSDGGKGGQQGLCGFGGNGGATVFGAAVMDAQMKHFRGNFSIVYVENFINGASTAGGFGSVAGGWTDFHSDWR